MVALNYYLDESGNTGDLITKKYSSTFGGQPIFVLSCLGVENPSSTEDFAQKLKLRHNIDESELKSEELYFKKPEAILEIVKYIYNNRLPLLIELVDKRYCVATAIVGHQIMPPYDTPDESDGKNQFLRNLLADFISLNLTAECYKAFYNACLQPSESNLFISMNELMSFFESKAQSFEYANLAMRQINEVFRTYANLKSVLGEDRALRHFIPIPDKRSSGSSILLLPHIHCKYAILGRLNKYHCKGLNGVALYHDDQDEFGSALEECIGILRGATLPANSLVVETSDFYLTEEPSLQFVNSKSYIGVQFSDILAGFANRYVNGFAYKDVDIPDIYHTIFRYIVSYNRPMSPLGVNFVIPPSKQHLIFTKFRI